MGEGNLTSTAVVILVRNEIDGLRFHLPQLELLKARYELIVIDGGSTDGSVELMLRHNYEAVIQENEGRGDLSIGF